MFIHDHSGGPHHKPQFSQEENRLMECVINTIFYNIQ